MNAVAVRCEEGCERIVKKLVRDNPDLLGIAEDLGQQARLALIEEAAGWSEEHPDSWLLWRVKMRVYDWLRVHGPGRRTAAGWRGRNGDTSLDAAVPSRDESGVRLTYKDIIPAPEPEHDPEALIAARKALATLSPREKGILVARYIGGKSQTEIAVSMGVSASRIAQIEKRALSRIAPRLSMFSDDAPATLSKPPQGRANEKALSPRQRQVLLLTGEGCSLKEIGDRLAITEETTKTYRKQIIARYSAANIAHAIVLALRAGDITLDEEAA